MKAYSANRQESAETALDNNNVAAAVQALMQAEGIPEARRNRFEECQINSKKSRQPNTS